MGQTATIEVLAKGLLDIPRIPIAMLGSVSRLGEKSLPMLNDQLVKHALFRRSPSVTPRQGGGRLTGFSFIRKNPLRPLWAELLLAVR